MGNFILRQIQFLSFSGDFLLQLLIFVFTFCMHTQLIFTVFLLKVFLNLCLCGKSLFNRNCLCGRKYLCNKKDLGNIYQYYFSLICYKVVCVFLSLQVAALVLLIMHYPKYFLRSNFLIHFILFLAVIIVIYPFQQMKAPVPTTIAFLNAILFLKNVVGPFREKIKSCY